MALKMKIYGGKNMKKYDWKKTAKKAGIIAGEIIIAGTIAYLTDYQLFLAIVPALEALRNYWKHRNKDH